MSTGAGICDLFQRNCTEILQRIFLYLDPASLHKSRQVCPQWNSFILSSVWGSKPELRTLQRRLHHNWLNTDPEVFRLDLTDFYTKNISPPEIHEGNRVLVPIYATQLIEEDLPVHIIAKTQFSLGLYH